jgi:hypothetical protein
MADKKKLTTTGGAPVPDNENAMTAREDLRPRQQSRQGGLDLQVA